MSPTFSYMESNVEEHDAGYDMTVTVDPSGGDLVTVPFSCTTDKNAKVLSAYVSGP